MASTEEDEKRQPQPWQLSEKFDEDQIVKEIRGEILEQYFYEFEQGGKVKVGMSWAGVKFVARRLAEQGHPISIEEIVVRYDDATYFSAMARAKDLSTGEVRFGASEQSRTTTEWDKQANARVEKQNPFAYALVVSKAQRNAIRHFIPETAIQEGYVEWRNKRQAQRAQQQAPAAR